MIGGSLFYDFARVGKVLDELEGASLVKTLRYTEGRLGSPASRRVLIAPLIIAEDRARATAMRIIAEAETAKKQGLAKAAEAERNRYHSRRQEESCGQGNHKNENGGLVVEATTGKSCGQDNHKKGLVVETGFSCGQGDHFLNHIENLQRDRGASARSPADAGSLPHNLNLMQRGHSVAASEHGPAPVALPPLRSLRSTAKAKSVDPRTDPNALAARDAYNEAARQHGWVQVSDAGFTPQLAKRLQTRLANIGGLEAFKRALSVAPEDDWMMGCVPAKDGRKRFRLDIDYLLQTDGRSGDVLAKLLDRAADAGASSEVNPILSALKENPATAEFLSDDQLRQCSRAYRPNSGTS
jgi:hypothetical protein